MNNVLSYFNYLINKINKSSILRSFVLSGQNEFREVIVFEFSLFLNFLWEICASHDCGQELNDPLEERRTKRCIKIKAGSIVKFYQTNKFAEISLQEKKPTDFKNVKRNRFSDAAAGNCI